MDALQEHFVRQRTDAASQRTYVSTIGHADSVIALGGHRRAGGGAMMQHHAMMDKRMDTMQMMQHDQAMESLPAK